MTSILVTTDLSDESTRAYPHAVKLAKALGTEIVLASFIDTSLQGGLSGPFDVPVAYIPEPLEHIRTRVSEGLNEHIRAFFPTMTVRSELKESSGPVHYGIVDYIASLDPELVVMASHGRSGLARTLMGSVTEQVLRRSPKPVLVVPVHEAVTG